MSKIKKGKVSKKSGSVIGKGLTLEGFIRSDTDIFVEGRIIGDVHCLGNVMVGEHGAVEADISSRSVTIAGTVTGNVSATDTLTITETGKLFGDIFIKKMIMMKGGILKGNCKMKGELHDIHAPHPALEVKESPEAVEADPSGADAIEQQFDENSVVAS